MNSTITSFSNPNAKEDEEEKASREAKMASIIEKYKDRVSTLQKHKSWSNYILCNYKGFWIPQGNWFFDSTASYSVELVMAIQDEFAPPPTTVFLASYPKSGTTWLKALGFAILNRTLTGSGSCSDSSGSNKNQNQNKNKNQNHPLLTTSPHALVPMLETEEYYFSNDHDRNHDDLLATHLPYTLLPKSVTSSNCRIAYICRDPKDAFLSFWHFLNKLRSPQIKLEDAFELFTKGISFYGSCWDHVSGYRKASLERPDEVLFLTYEKMIKETKNEVKKLAKFMGCPFSEDEEGEKAVDEIIEMCSFKKLREVNEGIDEQAHKAIPNDVYFRKGEAGDSVNYLTPEMIRVFDMITLEKYNGLDISF